MNISKYFTWRILLVVNLTMGISLPLYAVGPNPDLTPTTSKSVSGATVTKTRSENRHQYRNHCYHSHDCYIHHHVAHDMGRDSMEIIQHDNINAEPVVWKNGVIYHDINPTGHIENVPQSTSDTLHGGVTTTHEHQ